MLQTYNKTTNIRYNTNEYFVLNFNKITTIMYNGQVIKSLIKDRKLKSNDLINYLGVKTNSLSQLTNGNPTVARLEKVADFFGVSMDIFFLRNIHFGHSSNAINGNGNVMGDCNNSSREQELSSQIESLKLLLEEKDKRIETLEEMVKLLKK